MHRVSMAFPYPGCLLRVQCVDFLVLRLCNHSWHLTAFGYDVVILLMTLYAVHSVQQEQQSRKRWGVGDVLCIQGIGYVVVTCIVNIPVAALAFLDLNGACLVLYSDCQCITDLPPSRSRNGYPAVTSGHDD